MASQMGQIGRSSSAGGLLTFGVQVVADLADSAVYSVSLDAVLGLDLLALLARGVVVIDRWSLRLGRVKSGASRHSVLLAGWCLTADNATISLQTIQRKRTARMSGPGRSKWDSAFGTRRRSYAAGHPSCDPRRPVSPMPIVVGSIGIRRHPSREGSPDASTEKGYFPLDGANVRPGRVGWLFQRCRT
jgi:hypothetical protein